MSTIHLVRHGQASFGRSDYDKLSELGEQQSRLAGEALATRGVRPVVMVTGTLQRQQVTGSRMWEAAGWESAVETDGGWNEYDHEDIITAYKPAYRNQALMRADLARHRHPRRAFQEMFVEASARWASGDHDEDYLEPFTQFRDRVALALGRVTSRLGKGEAAVVVTSGGPMSWVAAGLMTQEQSALESALTVPSVAAPGSATVWNNLASVTVNTGIHTVVHGRSLRLLSTNNHDHLGTDPELTTYR